MSEYENPRPHPHGLGSVGIWLVAGAIVGLGFQAGKIAQRLEQSNSIFLCVELWKLGGESEHCDAMLAERSKTQ